MPTGVLSMTYDRDEGAAHLVDELLGLTVPAYRLALRLTGSPADAEDAVQQAYLEALRQLRKGDAPISPRAWFLGITANVSKEHVRGEVRRARREAVVRERSRNDRTQTETGLLLRAALEALEAKYQLPIALCYEEGLSQREAAAVLKMPESTVSKYVNVGLAKLRKALERTGHPIAIAAAVPGAASAKTGAALIAMLKQTAPAVPASLAGRMEALVLSAPGEAPNKLTSRAARKGSAAKGGYTMKLLAGIVLAAGVAAGVAVISGRSGAPLPAEAPPKTGHKDFSHTTLGGGKVFIEWAGLSGVVEHLDGPAREAMARGIGGNGTQGCNQAVASDLEGNIYFLDFISGSIRALRWRDRRMITLSGNGHITAGMPGMKGLARDLCLGQWVYVAAVGKPLDGDGSVYVSSHRVVARLFRKDGVWQYERVAGGGKTRMERVGDGGVAALEGYLRPRVIATKAGQVGVLTPIGPKSREGLFWLRGGRLEPACNFKTVDATVGSVFNWYGVDGAGSFVGFGKGGIVAVAPDGKAVRHRAKPPWKLPWGVHPDPQRERWFVKGMDDYVITRVLPDGSAGTLSPEGTWRPSSEVQHNTSKGGLGWAFGSPLLDGRYAGWNPHGGLPFFVGTFREEGDQK